MNDEDSRPRVGIFGGTFNPIHTGHLLVASAAFDALALSRVLFVPCARPALKSDSNLASPQHRISMARLAVAGDPRFEVSDIEIVRSGVSYAVDTLRELRADRPDAEFVFIVGMDSLRDLHQWRDVYSLLALCRFAIFSRPGYDADSMEELTRRFDQPWPRRLAESVFAVTQFGISSTDIRRRRAEGLSVRYMVPDRVEEYMVQRDLYARPSLRQRPNVETGATEP